MSELLVSDEAKFTNFIRKNKATFDILLVLLKMEPYFNTNDTKLRLVIPVQEKLAATSRILAAGKSFKSIHSFCLPFVYPNQLGSKAASESIFKKLNTCGVSNTRLYFIFL